MYYIDKLVISHFGLWGVPNFVMAASNHIVAAIQGTVNTMTSAWDSELIYLSDLSYQRKKASFAVSQLSSVVWLADLETRYIQGISLFKIAGRYARYSKVSHCVLVGKITCCGRCLTTTALIWTWNKGYESTLLVVLLWGEFTQSCKLYNRCWLRVGKFKTILANAQPTLCASNKGWLNNKSREILWLPCTADVRDISVVCLFWVSQATMCLFYLVWTGFLANLLSEPVHC